MAVLVLRPRAQPEFSVRLCPVGAVVTWINRDSAPHSATDAKGLRDTVSAIGFTCSDHFQPGSKVPRPFPDTGPPSHQRHINRSSRSTSHNYEPIVVAGSCA